MNPGQGLKISPFKDAHLPQAMADRELDKLARYMVHIATTHEDFRKVNHKVCDEPVRDVEQHALMPSDRVELAIRCARVAASMKPSLGYLPCKRRCDETHQARDAILTVSVR